MYFIQVHAFMSDTQGSFTSEIYLVLEKLKIPKLPTHTEITQDTLYTLFGLIKSRKSTNLEFNRAVNFCYNISAQGLDKFIPFISLGEIAIFLTTLALETGLPLTLSESRQ